ncbi:MAG: hypothetical protein ACRD0P_06700, partial [Stackebrandtia sp.]
MLPDPVTAVVTVLRNALDEVTVGTVVPGQLAASVPFVHIAQAGGPITPASSRGLVVEAARLAVTCWAGGDHAHARVLARRVVSVLLAARGEQVADAVITRCVIESAPAFVPDEFAPERVHRYV